MVFLQLPEDLVLYTGYKIQIKKIEFKTRLKSIEDIVQNSEIVKKKPFSALLLVSE